MKRYAPLMALAIILSPGLYSRTVSAADSVFTREYSYRATEVDSKITCRAIALENVKKLALEDLGAHLLSKTEVKNYKLTLAQVITLTAGIVSTKVIDEKWDGKTYYLKAMITADPEEVAKSVNALRKDYEKTKELEATRTKTDELLKEMDDLKKELKIVKSEPIVSEAKIIKSVPIMELAPEHVDSPSQVITTDAAITYRTNAPAKAPMSLPENVDPTKHDGFVKSPPLRHSGEGKNTEQFENTEFRVKHGMTKETEIELFARSLGQRGKNKSTAHHVRQRVAYHPLQLAKVWPGKETTENSRGSGNGSYLAQGHLNSSYLYAAEKTAPISSVQLPAILGAILVVNLLLIGGINYFLSGADIGSAVQGALVLIGPKKNINYTLYRKTLIGRKVMGLADATVSEKHCIVKCNGKDYTLQDLNSKNGTFLNKKKIVKETLKDSDVIEVGRSVFVVRFNT